MKEIYTIFDIVSKEAGPLFLANNDDHAVRNFVEILKKTPVREDYELHKVGRFNPEVPMVESCIPQIISQGKLYDGDKGVSSLEVANVFEGGNNVAK